VRGGPRGYAVSGNRAFEQDLPGVPGDKRTGNRFAAALALAPGAGSGRLDLTVAAPGYGRDGTLWILREVTGTLGAASTERLALGALEGGAQAESTIALGGAPGG